MSDTLDHVAAALPARRHHPDLFICDVMDAVPKDDMASMSHPVFALSTRPDKRRRRYVSGDAWVEVVPSGIGLATIHDKDVLIYCVSQLMAALNSGREVSRTVDLRVYDLLVATDRDTSGRGYQRLHDALLRLRGTTIMTGIMTGDVEDHDAFGLIEGWHVQRETADGRMISLQVTLSEWLYRAVLASEVLTISPDYFRLRKPLERRVYELVRKHCGMQARWQISLPKLQRGCGSTSSPRRFRAGIRQMITDDHLPDYRLSMTDDVLLVEPRPVAVQAVRRRGPMIRSDTWELARSAAPGYDVYALHEQWLAWWIDSGEPALRSPDAAFVGFCRRRHLKAPNP